MGWRSEVIQLRVSGVEKAQYVAAAKLVGKPLSEWIRDVLAKAAGPARK